MTCADFTALLYEDAAFEQTVSALWAGTPVSIDGAAGSSRALTIAAIAGKGTKPVLVIVPDIVQADNAANDIETFIGSGTANVVCVFPPMPKQDEDLGEANPFALSDENFGGRVSVLKRLNAADKRCIIVTTMPALLQEVPPKALLAERTQTLAAGQRIGLENLRLYLVNNGYHPTPAVDLPGEFASRGYIFDIFAPDWQQPVRLELFGDEIESLRRFDIATQRSLETVSEVDLTSIKPDESAGASLLDYLPADSPIILVEAEE
ncbi:MAG: hypothetical protein LBT89_05130, partial [Planctomycetaceae bacterium]|nr:hypothetical protein [Planctomycetaceae bacterium]